mmetsp:Transcript_32606/g.49861  ORF Transcript_32606/g.49861 Transcript_32606/m.49861 type:complete len:282 (-) Transcript_32606:466-1311(-)
MKEGLPHSAGYLIIQLTDDEQYILCGFMTISKDRRVKYFLLKLALSPENRDTLLGMIKTLAQNKLTMQKAPITIEEDLINLEKDSNEEITKLKEQLEAFFEPITSNLDIIINPPQEGSHDDEDPKAGGNAKAADPKKDDKKAKPPPPAKPAKGAGDAQLAAYESALPLPGSGLESIVLLIDRKIESLPFESLKIFKHVPVVARDFNLHMYLARLKSVGHQAELHNNKGVSKDQLSYIIDPPKSLETEAFTLVDSELQKMLPGSQWKGILTSKQHSPSVGEW